MATTPTTHMPHVLLLPENLPSMLTKLLATWCKQHWASIKQEHITVNMLATILKWFGLPKLRSKIQGIASLWFVLAA